MKIRISEKYNLNLTTFMDNIGGPLMIMAFLSAVILVWAMFPQLR